MAELLISILLGVVEGVTEFLPVSSTGHLLLTEHLLRSFADLNADFWKRFVVFIQIGAIAAVVVYFRDRLKHLLTGQPAAAEAPVESASVGVTPADPTSGESSATATATQTQPSTHLRDPVRTHPVFLIAIATVPVLVIGFLVHKIVEQYLETPTVIAVALIVGGVAMILIEKLSPPARTEVVEDITVGQALFIGLAQVLAAVFPGTSRSAATIMGGLLAGLNRPAAAEFSFFMAIPSMAAACGFSLLKMITTGGGLTLQQGLLLIIGTLTSFLVAWVVIAGFMTYIRRYSFVPFAVYRIVLGVIVLLLMRRAT